MRPSGVRLPSGKQDQVPARLEQLARAVQLGLGAAGPRERKGVEKQADDVAKQRSLEPVVGRRSDDRALAGVVAQRVEDERGVGVARVVGREDDGPLEVAHPLAALDLRVGHRLGERQQQPALDEVPDGPDRLLARPAQVACRRWHHCSPLGPAGRARGVPTPAFAHPAHVVDRPTDDACDAIEAAFARVPRHQLDTSIAGADGFTPGVTLSHQSASPTLPGVATQLIQTYSEREQRRAATRCVQ